MMAAAGCTSPVTWGNRGRRPSGHSRACGATTKRAKERRQLGAGSSQRLLEMMVI
ncbi:trans-sialidase, putative, partial [Trypanosoma cruzi]